MATGRTLTLGLAGLILPAIGVFVLVRSCKREAVSGEVVVEGGGVVDGGGGGGAGGWRAAIDRCRTGELDGFRGVSLGGGDHLIVKAIADVDRGASVELTAPAGGPPVVVTAAACPGLRLDLRDVDTDSEGAIIVDGSLSARCVLPDGRRVQVEAWWRRCSPH